MLIDGRFCCVSCQPCECTTRFGGPIKQFTKSYQNEPESNQLDDFLSETKIRCRDAKEFIADKGFDSQFGARPLKRAIQKYLEDPIAEEILKGELVEGDTMEVDYDKEGDQIKVSAKHQKGESETPKQEEEQK